MGGGEEDEPRVIPFLEVTSLPIPDELLAEILLRLPTPADLARASAGCVSFRRVAADRSFLRWYRKLHAPPLLSFFGKRNAFHPAIAPHSSASAATAVALAADFSFSFLPAPTSNWVLRDTRDGRVLLDRPRVHNSTVFLPEVVVCDSLHRRYLLLPPITADMAASVEDPFWTNKQSCYEIFLVPPSCDTADETSFGVIWMAQCKTMPLAFAFSSSTGQWTAAPSRRWSDLSAGLPPSTDTALFTSRHYVYGCFYWLTAYGKEIKLLVLDTKTTEFSIAEPPPEADSYFEFAMVEAGEGRLGMFGAEDSASDINSFIRENDGGCSSQWQKVKTITLRTWAHLICNMEKYVTCSCILGKKAHFLSKAVTRWTSKPSSLRRCAL